jgi:secretion system chaperone SscA
MKTLFDVTAEYQVQPIVEVLIKGMEDRIKTQKGTPLRSTQSQLKEFNQHKKELSEELASIFSGEEERHLISQGLVLLFNEEETFSGGKMCVKELKEASKEYLRPSEESKEGILCFNTVQEQYNLSDSCLHSVYGYATLLLQDPGQIDNALSLYTLLTQLNPYVFEYWLARGICWMEKQRYFEALYAFSMASLLEFDKSLPHLYSSQCYLKMNQEPLAKETFELVMSKLSDEDNSTYSALIADLKKQLKTK